MDEKIEEKITQRNLRQDMLKKAHEKIKEFVGDVFVKNKLPKRYVSLDGISVRIRKSFLVFFKKTELTVFTLHGTFFLSTHHNSIGSPCGGIQGLMDGIVDYYANNEDVIIQYIRATKK